MWPFSKKKQPRRAEAHRTKVQARPSFWQRLNVPGGAVTVLVGVGFVVVAGITLLFGEFGGIEQTLAEPWRGLYRAAMMLVALAVTLSMGKYLASYQPRVLSNHTRTISVGVLLLLALAVGRLFSLLNWPVMLLLIPALFVPIILTITYNQRMALGIGGFLAVLIMLTTTRLQRESLELAGLFSVFFVVVVAMVVAVFSLREIRSRSKIIEVGIVTGVSAGLAVWLMGLIVYWRQLAEQESPAAMGKEILYNSFWAIGAAIAVGLLIQGVLPLAEKVFQVATSMTLLEWCDANKPLLKHLALDAPGTYNHSLQIGTIAEMAAEKVGANGLLCRVGSYYHDVGKIAKASYFIENQGVQSSKHEKLTPAMSALVILGHVKDGVEIAKEYKLPRVLHQFIRQHHGTTLVEFFYHEARKRDPEGKVHESDYRHAGPKPQTPEAGIVMLADTVESAVRALPEATANRIELTVHNLLMKRLMDGQFDECDLTLRELHIIEESLVKSLCSMYHARVPYPEPEASSTNNNNGKPNNNK